MKRKKVIKRANTGKSERIHMVEKKSDKESPLKAKAIEPAKPKSEPIPKTESVKEKPAPVVEPVEPKPVEAPVDPVEARSADPAPVAPVFSGKQEDFPQWVRDDMAYKVAYGNWMARNRRAS